MKRIFVGVIYAWFLVLVPAYGAGAATPASVSRADSVLSNITIVTATGSRSFAVELAQSENERAQGLMFRKSLADNGGMLFIFSREERVAMWMKNTFIPLDMLFIDRQGRIINIARNTKPHSLEVIASVGPAFAVLEIAGGSSDKLGIVPGNMVRADFFK